MIENIITCGNCATQFDLNKNKEGCPLCGFGREFLLSKKNIKESFQNKRYNNKFISIPPEMDFPNINPIIDEEAEIWGSSLFFNDFFSVKFESRVLTWMIHEEKKEKISLENLMNTSIELINYNNLSRLKGFPNLNNDKTGRRLVDHFIRTATKMGLFNIEIDKGSNFVDMWKKDWSDIYINISNNGLKFSQLNNSIFDGDIKKIITKKGKINQVLSSIEQKWMIDFLKNIDKKGYREYTTLKKVYNFIGKGNNGNEDLRNWFQSNDFFKQYILMRSERARADEERFKKQIINYSRSFASAKISLLRELGIIKNKRNDYTIMGGL